MCGYHGGHWSAKQLVWRTGPGQKVELDATAVAELTDVFLFLRMSGNLSWEQWSDGNSRDLRVKGSLPDRHSFLIIISACCCPLLKTDLLNWLPAWPARCHLHTTTPRSLDEVVDPSGMWPSHTALSHAWSPLQYLFTPSAVRSYRSSRYVWYIFELACWSSGKDPDC